MGSAFHQLCPRYSGTLTPTAPTAIKLWDTFTFYLLESNNFYFCFRMYCCFSGYVLLESGDFDFCFGVYCCFSGYVLLELNDFGFLLRYVLLLFWRVLLLFRLCHA